jgi:G3E family GTPase
MADPAPVAQTFYVEQNVQKFARLDGIITLIDAKTLSNTWTRRKQKVPRMRLLSKWHLRIA